MPKRRPNLSPWAEEMVAKIAAASTVLERQRAATAEAEEALHALIEEGMLYGLTHAQITQATQLYSKSRLYQIKLRNQ